MVLVSGISFTVAFVIGIILVTPLGWLNFPLVYTWTVIGTYVFFAVSLTQIIVFETSYAVCFYSLYD